MTAKGEKAVRGRLAATHAFVAFQLPTSDIEDDGYEANYQFLRFFVEESEGLVHADSERF